MKNFQKTEAMVIPDVIYLTSLIKINIRKYF